MKPWEVWAWKFPDAGEHPAVVLGTDERVRLKPRVCVILCSTQRAARKPEVHEVILDEADGLDWETLCKCDVVYAAPKTELVKRRGSVTAERACCPSRSVACCPNGPDGKPTRRVGRG